MTRPPLTVLDTRLVATTFSIYSLGSLSNLAIVSYPPLLEFQAALTGAFGQLGHTAVIQVTATVEHDGVDALGLAALGHQLAHSTGGGLVAAVALDLLIQGGGGDQGS